MPRWLPGGAQASRRGAAPGHSGGPRDVVRGEGIAGGAERSQRGRKDKQPHRGDTAPTEGQRDRGEQEQNPAPAEEPRGGDGRPRARVDAEREGGGQGQKWRLVPFHQGSSPTVTYSRSAVTFFRPRPRMPRSPSGESKRPIRSRSSTMRRASRRP